MEVAFALSVTRTVKLYVPAVVGVPLNWPEPSKVRPGGCVPAVIAQFGYGGVPPPAVNVREYVTFTGPEGNGEVVVIANPGMTVNVKAAVAVVPMASVTRTVEAYWPGVVGVPLMLTLLPVVGFRDKPGGSCPAEMVQL